MLCPWMAPGTETLLSVEALKGQDSRLWRLYHLPTLKHVKVYCEVDRCTVQTLGLTRKEDIVLTLWMAMEQGFKDAKRKVKMEFTVAMS